MKKILKFEDYLKADKYRSQVILPLLDRNPIYDSARHKDEAIAFLHFNLYFYVFLKYIPNGQHTTYPTVEESFNNIVNNPRISKGEWVVVSFYQLKKEDALSLYPLIYSKQKEEDWFTRLKFMILKKSEDEHSKSSPENEIFQKKDL
ncbi:hypothetical protein AAGG74_18125 [Bacillus mexicanus]|uniref:hypothetical protein n=1 Tax=Bacillus mexicanus TaxID=2834415 RepID=UPI003D22C48A